MKESGKLVRLDFVSESAFREVKRWISTSFSAVADLLRGISPPKCYRFG